MNQTQSKLRNPSGSVYGTRRFGSTMECENGRTYPLMPEGNAMTIHIGRVFGIRVEKASELPKDDPRRKFKYSAVFQGNNIVTQNWEAAMFQDMGCNPIQHAVRKSS